MYRLVFFRGFQDALIVESIAAGVKLRSPVPG
jgi:hypothetical protein